MRPLTNDLNWICTEVPESKLEQQLDDLLFWPVMWPLITNLMFTT